MSGDTEKTKKVPCPHGKNPVACLDCEAERIRAKVSKVEKPSHYQGRGGLEVIDVIEAFGLTFSTGTAIKYLLRAGRKEGESLETDLNKALWYIRRSLKVAGLRDEVMERRVKDEVNAAVAAYERLTEVKPLGGDPKVSFGGCERHDEASTKRRSLSVIHHAQRIHLDQRSDVTACGLDANTVTRSEAVEGVTCPDCLAAEKAGVEQLLHFFNPMAEPEVTACGIDYVTVDRTQHIEDVTCQLCRRAVETGEIPGRKI